jgi:hypothetical protein
MSAEHSSGSASHASASTPAAASVGPIHVFVDFSNFWWALTNLLEKNQATTLKPSRSDEYKAACEATFASLR